VAELARSKIGVRSSPPAIGLRLVNAVESANVRLMLMKRRIIASRSCVSWR